MAFGNVLRRLGDGFSACGTQIRVFADKVSVSEERVAGEGDKRRNCGVEGSCDDSDVRGSGCFRAGLGACAIECMGKTVFGRLIRSAYWRLRLYEGDVLFAHTIQRMYLDGVRDAGGTVEYVEDTESTLN